MPAGESDCMGGSIGIAWTGAALQPFDTGVWARAGLGDVRLVLRAAFDVRRLVRLVRSLRCIWQAVRGFCLGGFLRLPQFLSVRQDTQVWRHAAPSQQES